MHVKLGQCARFKLGKCACFTLGQCACFKLGQCACFKLGQLACFKLGQCACFKLGQCACFKLGQWACFKLGQCACFKLGQCACFKLGPKLVFFLPVVCCPAAPSFLYCPDVRGLPLSQYSMRVLFQHQKMTTSLHFCYIFPRVADPDLEMHGSALNWVARSRSMCSNFLNRSL